MTAHQSTTTFHIPHHRSTRKPPTTLDLKPPRYLEQVGVPFAFLQLQWTLITTVVSERKSKVKEGMLMMGLRESAYWVSSGYASGYATKTSHCATDLITNPLHHSMPPWS